jgi:hypothetical protein
MQRTLIEIINAFACPVLALDTPSGLDADTGAIVGQDDQRKCDRRECSATAGIAVRASHTITFIANKPGLHTGHGRDCAGTVRVANLAIEEKHFSSPQVWLRVEWAAHRYSPPAQPPCAVQAGYTRASWTRLLPTIARSRN